MTAWMRDELLLENNQQYMFTLLASEALEAHYPPSPLPPPSTVPTQYRPAPSTRPPSPSPSPSPPSPSPSPSPSPHPHRHPHPHPPHPHLTLTTLILILTLTSPSPSPSPHPHPPLTLTLTPTPTLQAPTQSRRAPSAYASRSRKTRCRPHAPSGARVTPMPTHRLWWRCVPSRLRTTDTSRRARGEPWRLPFTPVVSAAARRRAPPPSIPCHFLPPFYRLLPPSAASLPSSCPSSSPPLVASLSPSCRLLVAFLSPSCRLRPPSTAFDRLRPGARRLPASSGHASCPSWAIRRRQVRHAARDAALLARANLHPSSQPAPLEPTCTP